MKTILKWTACAACAVWMGASASAATETVTGQNVIGLTTIENDGRAYLPLAAAYTGTGATELTVANIVQTSTLAEGDELYAYDPDKKQYDVYTLGTDGKWTAVKTVEVSASGKATVKLLRLSSRFPLTSLVMRRPIVTLASEGMFR